MQRLCPYFCFNYTMTCISSWGYRNVLFKEKGGLGSKQPKPSSSFTTLQSVSILLQCRVAAASILSGKQPPSIQHRILPIVDGKQPLHLALLPDTICLLFVHDVSYIHVIIKEVLSPVIVLAFVSSLLFSPPSLWHQILFCNATFICDVPIDHNPFV